MMEGDAYGVPMDGNNVDIMHDGQPPQLPMENPAGSDAEGYNMQFS